MRKKIGNQLELIQNQLVRVKGGLEDARAKKGKLSKGDSDG